jgi:hypothetical protein
VAQPLLGNPVGVGAIDVRVERGDRPVVVVGVEQAPPFPRAVGDLVVLVVLQRYVDLARMLGIGETILPTWF